MLSSKTGTRRLARIRVAAVPFDLDIEVPEGDTHSPAGEWSVHGIANRKQALVELALAADGVQPFAGSVHWVEQLRRENVRTAVVSSSANAVAVLAGAGIGGLFDTIVDGHDVERLGVPGKPVIGVARAASHAQLRSAGADVVVDDLAELVR